MKHYLQLLILAAVTVACLPQARAASEPDLDYVPAVKDAPARRIASGSRPCLFSSIRVWLLCPADHVGLTTRESPVIYWYLNEPTRLPVDIAVTPKSERASEPVLEITLKGPHQAGLRKLDLGAAAEGGKPVKLESGRQYEVAIEVVERHAAGSANPVAFCRVERVPMSEPLTNALKASDESAAPAAFAKNGVWFDAIAALNDRIEAAKADPKTAQALRAARRKLLMAQGIIEDQAGKISEAGPAK
jgi:hypothetical protein